MPLRCQLTLRTFWPLSSKRVHENRNKENQNAPNSVSANPMKRRIKGSVPSPSDIWRTVGLTSGVISKKTKRKARQLQPYLAFARKENLEKSEASISQYVHSKSNAFIHTAKLQKPNFHLAIQVPFIESLLCTQHRGLGHNCKRHSIWWQRHTYRYVIHIGSWYISMYLYGYIYP